MDNQWLTSKWNQRNDDKLVRTNDFSIFGGVKRSTTMENIFTVSKPFITILSFFGLFPMSFEGKAVKGLLEIKWHSVLCSAVCLSVSLYFFLTSCSMYVTFHEVSEIIRQAWYILTNLEFILYTILFCYQNLKCKSIRNLLNQVHQIDEEVNWQSFQTLLQH